MTEVIFETPHGSRLYGWAHSGSDEDIFRVTTSTHLKAHHRIEGKTDIVEMGLDAFLMRAIAGSHQSVEALFSQQKVWYNDMYRPMLSGMRVCGTEVFEKYGRTIKKFCFGDFKRRRHACRLTLNLRELRMCGTFNPEVEQYQAVLMSAYAKRYEGDELWSLLN